MSKRNPRRPSIGRWLQAAAIGSLVAMQAASFAQDMPNGSDTARRALHVCTSCHGEGGRSANAAFPSLAGQSAPYIERQLKDFRDQTRAETDARAYMWGVSALLDDATIQSLAAYYAAQSPAPGHATGNSALRARGQRIFEQGLPGTAVRACASCHGEKAEGASVFPRLAGQQAAYLERQMKVFGTRLRPHGVLMKNEVADLKPADVKAVAAYLQSL